MKQWAHRFARWQRGYISAPFRRTVSRGRYGCILLAVLSASENVIAAVYTGTNAYGIRWYSDTPPATGVTYEVLAPTNTEERAARSPEKLEGSQVDGSQEELESPEEKLKGKHKSQKQIRATKKALRKNKRKSAKRKSQPREPVNAASKHEGTTYSPAKLRGSHPGLNKSIRKPSTNARNEYKQRLREEAKEIRAEARYQRALTRERNAVARQQKEAKRQQKRCQQYEIDLRKIHAQLRAGYTAAQGRKLRLRRQNLQEQQFAECPIR